MSAVELFILAIGLAMDAFAVSVCKGLSLGRTRLRDSAIVGLWFGGFQALMPLIGYFLGVNFSEYISRFDHWIAFVLLGLIGANMIKEALSKDEEKESASCSCLGFKSMILMALATSIDALAVGITFAFLKVNILLAVLLIGLITFGLSAAGVKIGSVFGTRYKSRAEFAGGAILILLGIKILLEHLGVINF